ncbi:hypothetical protein PCANC_27984 [Puccinia coronata f. sp. avenae]|uniref:Uncharacterized protein n=1 Tax=Puccinia coronata f. sp. avenae TaxID=200324 RepID=A0A2N5TLX1_9BASI|nr:hypothetical protein PCANC_27984 [Puccinia coronata f. sp. avenae]
MDFNQDEHLQNLLKALSNLQIQRAANVWVFQTEVNSVGADIPLIKNEVMALLNFPIHPAPPPVPPPHFTDVPVMTHASFSGNPKEINQFLYFIKDWLVEVEARFLTEKSKINWVVCHFCYANGHMADSTPSYNWWISILKENAHVQQLNPQSASAKDPYVLPSLISVCSFLSKLEEVFADQTGVEDAKRALYSYNQGAKPLDVFNSHFSLLVYSVDLTEESRCDVYKRALNPKILEIAIVKDSWKSAATLREKMDLAVLASNILDELNILWSNMSAPRTNHQAPPPPAPAGTPMDIDAMSASVGFSFSGYCALCVKSKFRANEGKT